MVLTRRRILETFISPGLYVSQTVGLLLAYFLIAGFMRSIDSSGFNFQLDPIYDLISRSLSGAFGQAFTEKLFSGGPFLFVLHVAFLPVLLYLAVGSVFRFGLEKKVGAIELIAYGPADGTSYALASVFRDIFATVVYMAMLVVFFLVSGAMNNLVLGPSFFYSLAALLFLSVSIYAYGVLASAITENSTSALFLFIGLILFFGVIRMGSFTIVSGYVRNVASIVSWIIKWISPLFYWDLALSSQQAGSGGMFILGIALQLVLSALLFLLTHHAVKTRGVGR